jgi:uncharacterized protein with HEPN domain
VSHRDWRILIDDILEAIAKIQAYAQDMSQDDFAEDQRTIDAVVRNFIVIGEASGSMPPEVAELHHDIPWRLMRDMRNFAVHHYWGVDAQILWKTIREDLPQLVPQLKAARLAVD